MAYTKFTALNAGKILKADTVEINGVATGYDKIISVAIAADSALTDEQAKAKVINLIPAAEKNLTLNMKSAKMLFVRNLGEYDVTLKSGAGSVVATASKTALFFCDGANSVIKVSSDVDSSESDGETGETGVNLLLAPVDVLGIKDDMGGQFVFLDYSLALAIGKTYEITYTPTGGSPITRQGVGLAADSADNIGVAGGISLGDMGENAILLDEATLFLVCANAGELEGVASEAPFYSDSGLTNYVADVENEYQILEKTESYISFELPEGDVEGVDAGIYYVAPEDVSLIGWAYKENSSMILILLMDEESELLNGTLNSIEEVQK